MEPKNQEEAQPSRSRTLTSILNGSIYILVMIGALTLGKFVGTGIGKAIWSIKEQYEGTQKPLATKMEGMVPREVCTTYNFPSPFGWIYKSYVKCEEI